MTFGFAHLKIVVVLVVSVVLYLLADAYHMPIDSVLLFTSIGAVLAVTWDKLSSITAS